MDEKPSKLILADIYPEKVDAREIYTYQIEVSANADTKPVSSLGEISVEIPFDGYRHFNRDAAEKLNEYAVLTTASPHAQIGWLALGQALDWEHDWSRPPGIEKIALHVPLARRGLKGKDLWLSDKYRAVLRQEYTPNGPRHWPLSIDMEVYDDNTVMAESLDDYLERLNGPDILQGQLVFNLIIHTFLPQVLARKEVRPTLDRLKLKWPTIASQAQLIIYRTSRNEAGKLEYHNVGWRYDLDEQAIELRDLAFDEPTFKTGSPLLEYACDLQLWLSYPGEVIKSGKLTGSVAVRLQNLLLSGRELAWLDVSGEIPNQRPSITPITQQSYLNADFEILLPDQFARRNTATYRCWTFPGVGLSQGRLSDMAAALRDLGYQMEKPPDHQMSPDGKVEVGELDASRSTASPDGNLSILYLNVRLKRDLSADTRREREIPDGLLVSTELPTSDLIVEIFGRMNNPGNLLDLDLEQLMVVLQRRFRAVAELR